MALTEARASRIIYAGFPEKGIPMEVASGETVYAGDLLAVASNTVKPVSSDDAEHGRLVAGKNGVAGEIIPCFWLAIVGGLSGGVSGSAVYPADGGDGQYSETADVTGGDSNEIVGYTLTADMIIVMPAIRADSTA